MLVGLGNDIQALSEFQQKESLRSQGHFFTSQESDYCQQRQHPLSSYAGIFAAKEAFYKALPVQAPFFWTEVEITHNPQGAPLFTFSGNVRNLMTQNNWSAAVSISHSGDYAAAVVIVTQV